MVNEKEYEAMKKLVMRHDNWIKILYKLISLSEVMLLCVLLLCVLLISICLIYNDISFKLAAVLFVTFFVISCGISGIIQKNRM